MYGMAYNGWPGLKGIWMYIWAGEQINKENNEKELEEVPAEIEANESSDSEDEHVEDTETSTDIENQGGLMDNELRTIPSRYD